MHGVFLDRASLDLGDLDFSALTHALDRFTGYAATAPDEVAVRIRGADIVIVNKVVLDAATLATAAALKLICVAATGTNNVDLDAARARGIPVVNCRGYGTPAVAQHAILLMLALSTNFLAYQRDLAGGAWPRAAQFCLLDHPIRELAGKAYWSQFARSPEFAVLFLPGDQFLSAALAERPELIDNALRQSVVIATPSTLMALLKAIAFGWRQAQVAQNAAQIRDLGQELYRRLGNFSAHLGKVGQRLGGAVESYNSAVGSLERQVLPQARRFTELGVTADAALPTLEPVERLAREPDAPPGNGTP